MKEYTDIEQSRKLAEILPVESANMWWAERYKGRVVNWEYIVEETPVYYISFTKPSENNYSQDTINDIPCWSLTALLKLMPKLKKYYFRYNIFVQRRLVLLKLIIIIQALINQ